MYKIVRSIKPASSVRLYGVGSSGNPLAWGATGQNGIGLWLKTNATSGDTRAIYARMYFNSTGSGEVGRFFATISAANAGTGGTVNGVHCSINLDSTATSSVSGQASAGRFTMDIASATRTISKNISSLIVDSSIGANNTVPAGAALIRFAEIGSVTVGKAFRFPTIASGGMVAAHVTDSFSHSIRCVDDAGTVLYIMCTNDASNRTGGA